jgi:hypothetical protein
MTGKELPMSRCADVAATVYQAALNLYPPAFRREFGAEMVHHFREASRETRASEGLNGLAAFWCSIATDLLMTVVLEWCRTGLPLLTLASAIPVVTFLGVLSRIGRRAPLMLPEANPDRELLVVILLVAVLLLVIAATIIFTLWFARPLVYRRR